MSNADLVELLANQILQLLPGKSRSIGLVQVPITKGNRPQNGGIKLVSFIRSITAGLQLLP